MATIKGMLFDLGDTLLDFGPIDTMDMFEQGARKTYQYLKDLSQPVPAFGPYYRRQLRAIRWAYLKSRLTRREFNSIDLLGRLSRRMGHQLSDGQFEELAWQWYEPLSRQVTIEPGLPDLLEKFTRDGLKLAIISNTFVPGEALDRHLRQLGLLQYFPIRVYSCDVHYRKPHPEIFRLALRQAQAPAEEVAFVGDNLLADIRGGARAGMITILKDPTGQKTHRGVHPRYRIRRLAELAEIVKQHGQT